MVDFWNKLKVDWYRRGLKESDFTKSVMPIILARAGDSKSFLDIGAGPGTLSIPLAKAGKDVTAIDPSKNMIDALKEADETKTITTIQAAWGDDDLDIKKHDVVVCANVPDLLKGNDKFLREVGGFADKFVFLICSADPSADKFYYRELMPLIFNKEFKKRSDYLDTYSTLHSLAVFANVEIIEYDFDQPFTDLDEAIEFWKEYMGIVTEEHDARLRDFLKEKLIATPDGLLAKFHKKSAVIWWTTS
ncbi:MAG: class I SAM-dependent methyltransferase [Deltaproteobacteria bacterium]|nr:class I SAM-dependent methyltransferase [Deltaproteobacteria bacterium]